MNGAGRQLPQGTYVEVVRSVFATLLPTSIMSVLFVGVGLLLYDRTRDDIILTLLIAGGVLSAVRVTILHNIAPVARDPDLTFEQARRIERAFAYPYLLFATLLGLFGARAFVVAGPELHMVVGALMVGYAAGVASGVYLRAWIALPAIMLAVGPVIAIALLQADDAYRALAIVMAALVAGGINSLLTRSRLETANITMRRTFAALARRDHLTGLPNRLALAERYRDLMDRGCGPIGVHCLDLDHFKPVNDLHGHPAGDALLKAVAVRLSGMLSADDFVARLGGDEFAILQRNVADPLEVAALAQRIEVAIADPFRVAGLTLRIGVSVGHVLSKRGDALDLLVARADEALCLAKTRNASTVAPQYRGVAGRPGWVRLASSDSPAPAAAQHARA